MDFGGDLFQMLTLGGPIVAVLGLLSVVAVAIVLLKLYQFVSLDVRSRRFVEPVLAAAARGDASAALAELSRTRNPIARVMESAIRGLQRARGDDALVREEVARVGAVQLSRLESFLRGLETIGNLSPLLGLLGTVTGMIGAFQRLEDAGTRVDPAILSGGIWEALLTTAVGLVVAIPVIAVLSLLEGEVDRIRREMSDAVTRLFTARLSERLAPGFATDLEVVREPAEHAAPARLAAEARHAV